MADRPKGRRPSGAGPQPPHFPPGRAFVVQFSAAEESEKPTSGRNPYRMFTNNCHHHAAAVLQELGF